MQNLVSKNPIQRFKQGKKIVKASLGDILFPIPGLIWKTEAERPLYETGTVEYKNGKLRNKSTKDIVNAYSKDIPVSGGVYTPNEYQYFLELGQTEARSGMKRKFSKNPNHPYSVGYQSILDNNTIKDWEKYNDSESNKKAMIRPNSISNKFLTSRHTTPVNNRWVNGIQKHKEINDVREWQQKLKDFYEPGKFAVDGKWGKNTEAAYQKYLQLQNVPTESPEIKKADEVYNTSENNQVYPFSGKTLPTPDYGYYSPSSYGTLNPRWLKTAGATNIEGFRNLVNTNSQLKNDLLNRYGENWEQYLFDAAGVNANKRHFGRKSRKLINNALQNVVNTLNDNYMDKVRAYDQQYGLYKQGGQLVSRNPINRFKNKKK